MDLSRETQKRKEFCDILFELAKSQELLQDAYNRSVMYKRLELLYDAESSEKPFRHFYSDIFYVLTQIQQNPKLGDINILGQNIDVIRDGYNPQNRSKDGERIIDVTDAINKLYDHLNLDIARIMYSDAADRRISGEAALENIQTQINSIHMEAQKIKEDFSIAEKKIVKVEEKIAGTQKEYVTILGIFAAVVLAFTGGIAFSTSVLNNIAQAGIYRTIIITLLIGLILVNILFGLFYYINSLDETNFKFIKSINSLVGKEHEMHPLIISNSVIIAMLFITVIAWNVGWVENRDKRVQRGYDTQTNEDQRNYSVIREK